MLTKAQLQSFPYRSLLQTITGNLLIVEPTTESASPSLELGNFCYFKLYLLDQTDSNNLQGWQISGVENLNLIGNFMSDCKLNGMLYFWGNSEQDKIEISGIDSCPKILLIAPPNKDVENLYYAVTLLKEVQLKITQLEEAQKLIIDS